MSHYEAQLSDDLLDGRRVVNDDTQYHDYIRHHNFGIDNTRSITDDTFDLILSFTVPRDSDKQFIIRFTSSLGSTNSEAFSIANDCPKGN